MQRKHLFRSLFAIGAVSVLAGCPAGGIHMTPPAPPTPTPYVYHVYVAEYGLNQIEAFDLTGKSLATIPTGSHPSRLTYDSRLGILWSVNSGSGSITRIDPKTDTAVITIAVGGSPVDAVAAPNDSHLLYVADGSSNSVAVVDESSNSVIGHITTSAHPFGVQANADYVGIAQSDNSIMLVDDTKPSISAITTIKTAVPLAGFAMNTTSDPAIETNDGKLHLYSTTSGGALPWSSEATVTLGQGAGELDSAPFTDVYTLIYPSKHLVEAFLFDTTAPSQTFTMNVGNQPGWMGSDATGSSDGATYFVPNAGDDTVSTFKPNYQPLSTWHLAAGAHPVAALGIYYIGTSSPTPTASPTPSPTATPTTAPTATPTSAPSASGHLYVANGSGGNLLEYSAPFSAASTPTVNVNIGGNIWGVAANASYVAVEDNTGFIYLFAQPLTAGSSPVAQFQGGGSGGQLLFDGSGNLFSTTLGAVTLEFSPPFSNATVPSATISGSVASFSLAMDASGNLYVGNLGANEIDVFAKPYTGVPTKVMQPGTYSLAYDQNALYGADAMNNAVDLYSLPLGSASTPVFTIPVTDPHALTFDSVGNLYAADQTDKKIEVFAQPFGPTSAPTFSIASGLTEPVQIDAGP